MGKIGIDDTIQSFCLLGNKGNTSKEFFYGD